MRGGEWECDGECGNATLHRHIPAQAGIFLMHGKALMGFPSARECKGGCENARGRVGM